MTDQTAEKEGGYDEWLQGRLKRAIADLDSGAMKSHPIEAVEMRLQESRIKRMANADV
jgi:hypothetical protein